MSPLAWRILSLFIEHVQDAYKGEFGRGYIASWTLGELLGGSASTIHPVNAKIFPSNSYEAALHELLEKGLIEEMESLHCRYRLVVSEKKDKKISC